MQCPELNCYSMNNLFSIFEYLEDNDGYKNKAGIVVQSFGEGQVYISSIFPESSVSQVVSTEVNNVFEELFFVKLFQLKCVADLESITQDKLLRLYEVGVMEVNCLVDEGMLGGELVFRKTTEGILVRDGETNTAQMADREVSTFDDFVSYKSKYFLLKQVFWGEQGKGIFIWPSCPFNRPGTLSVVHGRWVITPTSDQGLFARCP